MATNKSTNVRIRPVASQLNRLHWEACMDVPRWYVFLGSSFACFFGGIAVILIYRAVLQLVNHLKVKCSRCLKSNKKTYHSTEDGTQTPSEDYISRQSKTTSFSLTAADTDGKGDASNTASVVVTNTISFHQRLSNSIRASSDCVHMCALRLVSYQWISGRCFIGLSMVLSLCSFGIYVFEASMWPGEVEKCGHKGRRFRFLDFLMNVFFALHFVARLLAARDALVFWIEWFSILDYLTIPPTLLGFWIRRTWLGFRFVRAFRLMNLAEVLHNFNMINSASSLRLCHFCTLFLSIWLSGAGMYLLLENTGDVLNGKPYNVSQPITYVNSLYFTIVTMSTVGYGDFTPQTPLGRAYVIFFILVALATFASAIPVIAETFFSVRNYSGSYVKPEGRSHIVVCGDITTDSVKTFLSDFLHEDRERSDVEVVFINPCLPDLQLQSILRLHFSRVKYFQGTVMDYVDLQRVRMDEADACLILASSTASDADQKDAANIMRVIAVKNYASHVRVIVQLLQIQNKAHLFNSPYWNWDGGDEIICFSELKLGFLAQSCIAPGFSTLLTNLFSMQSERGLKAASEVYKALQMRKEFAKMELADDEFDKRSSAGRSLHGAGEIRRSYSQHDAFDAKQRGLLSKCPNFIRNIFRSERLRKFPMEHTNNPEPPLILVTPDAISESPTKNPTPWSKKQLPAPTLDQSWVANYLHGLSMEIYSARLSCSFEGLTFAEAAVICRQKLDLLLIAVVAKAPTPPKSYTRERIRTATLGFDDYEEEIEELVGKDETNRFYLAISPVAEAGVRILNNTLAFFICDSQVNANRASVFCSRCHEGKRFLKPSDIKSCDCNFARSGQRGRLARGNLQKLFSRTSREIPTVPTEMQTIPEQTAGEPSDEKPVNEPVSSDQMPCTKTTKECERPYRLRRLDDKYSKPELTLSGSRLDITGMHHCCQTRSFEESRLGHSVCEPRTKKLVNHILLCLLVDEDNPLIGLHSFVMPLRASHFHSDQLKPIVLLGHEEYLRREWPSLKNFPGVYCLPGSPLSRADLRAARIRYCSVCVILGTTSKTNTDDPYMLDKEAILCSLNIRGMHFPPITSPSKRAKTVDRRSGSEIPIITELLNDGNIHYLDPHDIESESAHVPPPLTAPFARGIAFTSSVLDVLASTTYFDRNAMSLIRHLITGGVSPALEQWLSEGDETGVYRKGDEDAESDNETGGTRSREITTPRLTLQRELGLLGTRQRPRVAQLSVLDSRFRPPFPKDTSAFSTFGELYCYAIQEKGILCLGLYRSNYVTEFDLDLRYVVQLSAISETKLEATPLTQSKSEKVKVNKERRLSTTAQPVDQYIRKYSLQLQREQSLVCARDSETRTSGFLDRHLAEQSPMGVVNRYVITNPPNKFRMYRSDLVFCLCPFESNRSHT
ncbi:unnamed protein product [Dicrocoelium dendriticum]|nr:unnamed protein product [Dicrocoelium dendriticum]